MYNSRQSFFTISLLSEFVLSVHETKIFIALCEELLKL